MINRLDEGTALDERMLSLLYPHEADRLDDPNQCTHRGQRHPITYESKYSSARRAILNLMEEVSGTATARLAERDQAIRGLEADRNQTQAALKAAYSDIDAVTGQCNRLAADVVERDQMIATVKSERDEARRDLAAMADRAHAAELRAVVAETAAAERAEHLAHLTRTVTALEELMHRVLQDHERGGDR